MPAVGHFGSTAVRPVARSVKLSGAHGVELHSFQSTEFPLSPSSCRYGEAYP